MLLLRTTARRCLSAAAAIPTCEHGVPILGAANRRVLRLMMRNWRHFVSLEQRYRRLLQGLHKPFRPLMGRPAWKPPASPFQQLHGVVTPTTKRISL